MTSETHTSIEFFKKEAKKLLKSLAANDEELLIFSSKIFPDKTEFSLMNTQHMVAINYGFSSWSNLIHASQFEILLAITMDKNSMLTSDGWGIAEEYVPGETYQEKRKNRPMFFEEKRKKLRSNWQAVEKTFIWIISNIKIVNTINYDYSSYGLKHRAEHEIGYIHNGVFVAAAIMAGYPYKTKDGSINVHFGMSKINVNEIYNRQKETDKVKGNLMLRV